jgi:hypothetical protein
VTAEGALIADEIGVQAELRDLWDGREMPVLQRARTDAVRAATGFRPSGVRGADI